MGLKDICTTQETSRKLKEAGFPQEGGIAYWLPLSGEHLYTNNPGEDWKLGLQIDRTDWFYIPNRCAKERSHTKYRAFTFNELWDLLPREIIWQYGSLERERNGTPIMKQKAFNLTYNGVENRWGYWNFRDSLWLIANDDFTPPKNIHKPQEAAAELALWCVKEGYLNLKERE